uniref:Uncharacterized protein n=1 Tax=Rhizophora mucronata TaxID=61149 RepID=A0A2P2N9Y2_RHIMU
MHRFMNWFFSRHLLLQKSSCFLSIQVQVCEFVPF